jgi:hypothetical protein
VMWKAAACEGRIVGAGGQFFVRRARQGGSVAERKKMIDRTVKLSVRRQAIVLGIRRAVYITGSARSRSYRSGLIDGRRHVSAA